MFYRLCFCVLLLVASAQSVMAQTMQVYKSPTCGCCQKWIDHLNQSGFEVSATDTLEMNDIKTQYQIGSAYRSCHTGVVVTEQGGYVFEGHIPASVIQSFLNNPPEGALGLSVPGMPIGSPGMEVGDRRDYYEVLLLKTDGSSEVFAKMNED